MHFIQLLILILSFKLLAAPIEEEGCPENSLCQKKMANLKNNFINKIKKNDFSSKELSFPVWFYRYNESLPMIAWDSPCLMGSDKIRPLIGELITSNLLQFQNNPNIVFSYAILKKNNNYTKYIIPRGEIPQYITKNGLYFLMNDEGTYYGLLAQIDFKIKIIPPLSNNYLSNPIDCPKDLEASFIRESKDPKWFNGIFCKEIFDEVSKKHHPMAFGRSCL